MHTLCARKTRLRSLLLHLPFFQAECGKPEVAGTIMFSPALEGLALLRSWAVYRAIASQEQVQGIPLPELRARCAREMIANGNFPALQDFADFDVARVTLQFLVAWLGWFGVQATGEPEAKRRSWWEAAARRRQKQAREALLDAEWQRRAQLKPLLRRSVATLTRVRCARDALQQTLESFGDQVTETLAPNEWKLLERRVLHARGDEREVGEEEGERGGEVEEDEEEEEEKKPTTNYLHPFESVAPELQEAVAFLMLGAASKFVVSHRVFVTRDEKVVEQYAELQKNTSKEAKGSNASYANQAALLAEGTGLEVAKAIPVLLVTGSVSRVLTYIGKGVDETAWAGKTWLVLSPMLKSSSTLLAGLVLHALRAEKEQLNESATSMAGDVPEKLFSRALELAEESKLLGPSVVGFINKLVVPKAFGQKKRLVKAFEDKKSGKDKTN